MAKILSQYDWQANRDQGINENPNISTYQEYLQSQGIAPGSKVGQSYETHGGSSEQGPLAGAGSKGDLSSLFGGDKDYYGPIAPPEFESFLQGGPNAEIGAGVDEFGRPTVSGSDEYSLPPELTLGSSYDPETFDQLKDFAYSTEDSPWLQGQRQLIESDYDTAEDRLKQQLEGGLTNARENLAMRRGLTSGAGERLEERGIFQKMLEQQRLGRGELEEGYKMNIAEQEGKMNIRKLLPGYEMERARYETGIQEGNIQNIIGERDKSHLSNLERYKTQMGAWGAAQTAQATTDAANSSGGGGFISGFLSKL